MGDVMNFPERIDDFIEQYSFRDDERTYTNGSMLIPVFRVKQAIEHYMSKWIPCSERLPEKTGYYLVQLSRKLPNEDYSDRVVVLYNGEDKEFMAYERLIVAWMPLPESYKKKGA